MADVETRLAALEQEVQALRDRLEIARIVASYGPLADTATDDDRRLKAGQLFAERGVYNLAEDWEGTGPAGVGQLLAGDSHVGLLRDGCGHVLSAPAIRLDGDEALAVFHSCVFRHQDGKFIVWRVSANRILLARTADGWKITDRRTRLLDGSDEARAILRNIDAIPPLTASLDSR